jgi:glycosyltransferase involved in cell wall biosynthesis
VLNPPEHSPGLVVGVDASRNRSGGARAYLIGFLTECDPEKHGIREVHVWAPRALLSSVPNRSWLVKHSPPELEKSLPNQLLWQATQQTRAAKKEGCDLLFTTDASTLCCFKPMVVLSQDMLSYEPGVIQYFGFGKQRLRLLLILLLQNRAFRFADGVIFLTRYTAKVIQQSCGPLARVAYIPHGVGSDYKQTNPIYPWPSDGKRAIRCLYVSNADMYKHQWVVVRAIEHLRKRGYNLSLTLIGGGRGRAQRLLDDQIIASDPKREFVQQLDFVPQKDLPEYLANADLFVFASSCENMPITLLEAMAVGLPIACSNRGPMPEVLKDGGVYFDPEDDASIAAAIEHIINGDDLREAIAERAKTLADQYTWARCADDTWNFVVDTFETLKHG